MTCIGSHFSIGGRERKENPEPGRQAGGIVREGRVSAVLFVEEERINEYEVG